MQKQKDGEGTSSHHCLAAVVQISRKNKGGITNQTNCLEVIKDYKEHTNRVEKFDQLKAFYEADRKSKKRWHRIFIYFLEASVANAFIISKGYIV